MTYLSDRAKNRRQYRYYFVAIALIALVAYFWPVIRTSIYPYIEPVVIKFGNSKNSIFSIPSTLGTYFTSRKDLAAQNATLSLSVEHLENELAEKNAFIKEYALKEGVGHAQATLIMYPLLRDVTTIYSSLLLSRGFKDGVTEDDLVYIRGHRPVCVIAEVYDRTSLCKLLTASGVITEGVDAASSLSLSLVGDGGGTFVVSVPRDTPVQTGDTIYLKSDPSMVLGVVTDITRDNQAVAWKIYIKGSYNPVTSNVFYITK